MKISDLENYSQSIKNKGTKDLTKKEKVPAFNSIGQKVIDLSIAIILRFIAFIITFKMMMLTLPKSSIEMIQSVTTPVEIIAMSSQTGIDKLSIKCAIFAFLIGTAYYVVMASKCKFGTIGMKVAGLTISNRNGERPTIWQAMFWYHLRLIYPICGILAILTFVKNGVDGIFVILLTISAFFSDTPRMIFGISSLDEKISGVKILRKK